MPKLPRPKPSNCRGLESPPGPLVEPPKRDEWSQLRAISIRSVASQPHGFCQWHTHPFDELCLMTDGATLLGRAGRLVSVRANTLHLYHRGEQHGYWNDSTQNSRFWVVHFPSDPQVRSALPRLDDADSERRCWRLTLAQVETFKWLFMRLSVEHSSTDPGSAVAESAWLRLLLTNVNRWAAGAFSPAVAPAVARPDLHRLWQVIQECSGRMADFRQRIREIPNYNSLRQDFTATFGCSPSQMGLRLRIGAAKNLLLESPLSIKQIAEELGYARQHEFTRAFHRVTGCSPTAWREIPH